MRPARWPKTDHAPKDTVYFHSEPIWEIRMNGRLLRYVMKHEGVLQKDKKRISAIVAPTKAELKRREKARLEEIRRNEDEERFRTEKQARENREWAENWRKPKMHNVRAVLQSVVAEINQAIAGTSDQDTLARLRAEIKRYESMVANG